MWADERSRADRVLVHVLVLALAACGGAAAPPDPHEHPAVDAGQDADEEPAADGEAEAAFEGCPDSVPPFALGMQARVVEGSIHASVIEASPAPPMRYLNDWTVELSDAQGNALEDVRIESARPFMPVHGHDGNLQPKVRALSEPGRFSVADLNLFMRGPWEIQLRLHAESAGDGYVVFDVCVAE